MSATEIINELPKLTEAERRAVGKKLAELARTKLRVGRVDSVRSKPQSSRTAKLPDFGGRAKKIFSRPIPKDVVAMVDRLIAGE